MKGKITQKQLREVKKALAPLDQWASHCHGASLAVVQAEIFPESRVARGFCMGVTSQHSWVVVGTDCYDTKAAIVDPTLWSYDDGVKGIWVGTMEDGRHKPHGMGSIWDWGRPDYPTGEHVSLEPPEGGWSDEAENFLDVLGPLDEQGWRILANAPVEGWPAAEILSAIADQLGSEWVPIDIIGMLTDRNPQGLYV